MTTVGRRPAAGGAFALTTVIDDWLWVLRREGLAIAPSDVVTIVKGIALVGWGDAADVRDVVASVVAKSEDDDAVVRASFERFFFGRAVDSLGVRLALRGLTAEEIVFVSQWLSDREEAGGPLGAWLERGASFDRLLLEAGLDARARQAEEKLLRGFVEHKLAEAANLPSAMSAVDALATRFRDVFGEERALAVSRALSDELHAGMDVLRAALAVRREHRPDRRSLADVPLASLSSEEESLLRSAVRHLAERLRGGARVRARRGKTGAIHGPRTFRAAQKTYGVPFTIVRRRRRPKKEDVVFLCDVSDSVRRVAKILLAFVYYAQDLLRAARSFVFVSDVGEVTSDFQRGPLEVALARIFSGDRVSLRANSNYGRALVTFATEVLPTIGRGTTVVILGDGRGNFHSDGRSALALLRARARAVIWLCPEPRAAWSIGDSRMTSYASAVTRVLETETAKDLEAAMRSLV